MAVGFYIRLDDNLPDHRKVMNLSEKEEAPCMWLFVAILAYCHRNNTDGRFPAGAVSKMTRLRDPQRYLSRLVSVGFVEKLPDGQFYAHDYPDYQQSAEEMEEMRARKSAAGRKGAASRWGKRPPPDGNGNGSRMAGAMAGAMAEGWQVDGKAMADKTRQDVTPSSPPAPAKGKRPDDDLAEATWRWVAVNRLAEREAGAGPVGNRDAWLRKVVSELRLAHQARARAMLDDDRQRGYRWGREPAREMAWRLGIGGEDPIPSPDGRVCFMARSFTDPSLGALLRPPERDLRATGGRA